MYLLLIRRVVVFFIIALITTKTYPQQKGVIPNDQIPLDPELIQGKLPNGLTYYLKSSNDGSGKVSFSFVVKAGFYNEKPDQWHVSHVLEHCAFSKGMRNNHIADRLRQLGLQSGKDFGAGTGFFKTSYYINAPKVEKEKLKDYVAILSDWSSGLILDSLTIEAERGNVMNELGSEDFKGVSQRLISNENRFLVPGKAEFKSLRSFKQEALIRFYKDWYKPGNQAVIIVGDFDLDIAKQTINEMLGEIPKSEVLKLEFMPKIPDTIRFKYDIKSKIDELSIEKSHNILDFDLLTEGDYKRLAITRMLGFISRLRLQDLKISEKSIETVLIDYFRGPYLKEMKVDALKSYIKFSGNISKTEVEHSIRQLLIEEERLVRYGLTNQELMLAKKHLIKEGLFEKNNPLNDIEQYFLGKARVPDEKQGEILSAKIIRKISNRDITDALHHWRNFDRYDIVIKSSPKFSSCVPDISTIKALIKEVQTSFVSPYKNGGSIIDKPLMKAAEIEKLPKNAEYKQSFNKEIGFTEMVLKNGIRVLLKPVRSADIKKGEIEIFGYAKGGTGQYHDASYYNALYASTFALKSGLRGLNERQLSAWSGNHNINFSAYITESLHGLRGKANIQDLESFMQIIYLFCTEAKIDPQVFDDYKSELISRRSNQRTISQEIGLRFVKPRAAELTKGEIDSLNLKSMTAIVDKQLKCMGEYTFVFSGDFDPKDIYDTILRYLSCIPPPNSDKPKSVPLSADKPPLPQTFQLIQRSASSLNASMGLHFYTEAVITNQEFAEASLLGMILKNLMFRLLREKMGQTYSVIIGNELFAGNIRAMSILSDNNFGKINESIVAAKNELQRLKQDGPPPDIFELSVNMALEKAKADLKTPAFWLDYFAAQDIVNHPYTDVLFWPQIIKGTSLERTKIVANKLLPSVKMEEYEDSSSN